MNQHYPMTPYYIASHLEDMAERQNDHPVCWTYAICFDFGNEYLRVGYTPKLTRRLHSHMSRAPEWPLGVLIHIHPTAETAKECERYMIRSLSPYRRKPDWFLFDNLTHLNSILGSVRDGVGRRFSGSPGFVIKQSNDPRHRNGFLLHSHDGTVYLDDVSGTFVFERKKENDEEE